MLFDLFEGRSSIENPNTPLSGEELSNYIEGVTGGSVSVEAGMKLAAVHSCIYILSSSIAQLPLHVLRVKDNKVEKATDHPAYYLLHDDSNYWQSSYDWRETKQSHVAGWGNGYTRLIRNNKGELIELRPAMPWETSLIKTANRWTYAVDDSEEGALAVNPDDMMHVRALGSKGRIGSSIIRQHADTIGLGISALSYGNQFFGGGGRPTGLVTTKGALNTDSWGRLKEIWKKSATALKTSENKTLLLPHDLDYKSLTVPPEEAQFLETRKFNRSEIAGLFNVPAHMINDLEKATFSNISEQAIQFVRHTVMPWVVKWEQEANRKIFTKAERMAGYYCKFNLAGLLRGTPKERAEFYHYGITDGWMNRNEARVFEEMNPEEGLNEFLVSVNASQPATNTGENDE
ncbi:phage portal protein [Glaciecola sp. 2405UD65-10]|uniref:phage portal protein n=1 Tax=Glaciecola sp. 2405UD65-10 TaxID=3397244 RepID=UPI003B5C82F0